MSSHNKKQQCKGKRGRTTSTLLLVIACGLPALSWSAEDLIEQWYLQPRLNLGEQTSLNNLNHQTLSIGKALNQRIDLEINLLSETPDLSNDKHGILIDGRYYLKSHGNFNPYIAGGISSVRNDKGLDTSYQSPVTNLGLGFEHTLKANGAKIQADIRYFIDDRESEHFSNNEALNDWTLSFGLSIPLSVDLFK